MYFAAYDKNGNITRHGHCNGQELEAQGETVVYSDEPLGGTYLKDGNPIKYTAKQIETLSQLPALPSYWSNESMSWVAMLPQSELIAIAESSVRSRRNAVLRDTDWTDTISAKDRLGEESYRAWQAYRQALRDITEQPGYPLDVVWPTPPQ